MKTKVKYVILLFILSMIISITLGCWRKVEDIPQQPPIVENEIDDKQQGDTGTGEKEDSKEEKETSDPTDQEAVLIKLENQAGKEISIKQYSDKLLIMTFWVDWDLQSKEQLQVLENIYPLMQDDVRLVGIHATGFDTLSKEAVKEKISKAGYSFPMLIDESLEAQQKYYVGGFPTTVLIDYKGNVIKSYTSVIQEDELLDTIETTLEKLLP